MSMCARPTASNLAWGLNTSVLGEQRCSSWGIGGVMGAAHRYAGGLPAREAYLHMQLQRLSRFLAVSVGRKNVGKLCTSLLMEQHIG